MKIISIDSFQILNSKGIPTIKTEIVLSDGSKGSFEVPSGSSTGKKEALELKDKNKDFYFGKSVLNAIKNIDKIKEEIIHKEFHSQEAFDNKLISLDGTKNKSKLGANAILSLSVAFCKACAMQKGKPLHLYLHEIYTEKEVDKRKYFLPQNLEIFSNIINGGVHAGNDLQVQEFMIIPKADTIQKKIRLICEIYNSLKSKISKKFGLENTGVGDEGGFMPNIQKNPDAINLIKEVIEEKNLKEEVIRIGLDCAGNELYDIGKYYEVEKTLFLDGKKILSYYIDLIKEFNLYSIEDPFREEDKANFEKLLKKVGKKCFVVGDDLTVTNPNIIKNSKLYCNALIIKLNQIGTLNEAISAIRMGKHNKQKIIVSHRSQETNDSFIVDLAVGTQSDLKIGAPCRGERIAKYNRLLEIYKID